MIQENNWQPSDTIKGYSSPQRQRKWMGSCYCCCWEERREWRKLHRMPSFIGKHHPSSSRSPCASRSGIIGRKIWPPSLWRFVHECAFWRETSEASTHSLCHTHTLTNPPTKQYRLYSFKRHWRKRDELMNRSGGDLMHGGDRRTCAEQYSQKGHSHLRCLSLGKISMAHMYTRWNDSEPYIYRIGPSLIILNIVLILDFQLHCLV